MSAIHFETNLAITWRRALEDLLFFNPNQKELVPDIVSAVEEFGVPRILVEGDRLSITLDKVDDAQSLYAVVSIGNRSHLAGIVVFSCTDTENLTVHHIAVHPEYTRQGTFAETMLVIRLIGQVRDRARNINGIRFIRILYGRGSVRRLCV